MCFNWLLAVNFVISTNTFHCPLCQDVFAKLVLEMKFISQMLFGATVISVTVDPIVRQIGLPDESNYIIVRPKVDQGAGPT